MITRRSLIEKGGALMAALLLPVSYVRAQDTIEIEMGGTANGSKVWFDPIGLRVSPGQTIRWINRDRGNSHTATAYHPQNAAHSGRIPATAMPWDSGYLLPGQSFQLTLTVEGVYDYYCRPHEHAGMVGRIIVGRDEATHWPAGAPDALVPEAALNAFPPIETVLAAGFVRGI